MIRGGIPHGRLQTVEEVHCPLRLAGGGENRPIVILQDLQPVGDVTGVVFTRLERQVQIRADEGGAQLGYQFLDGISL